MEMGDVDSRAKRFIFAFLLTIVVASLGLMDLYYAQYPLFGAHEIGNAAEYTRVVASNHREGFVESEAYDKALDISHRRPTHLPVFNEHGKVIGEFVVG